MNNMNFKIKIYLFNLIKLKIKVKSMYQCSLKNIKEKKKCLKIYKTYNPQTSVYINF